MPSRPLSVHVQRFIAWATPRRKPATVSLYQRYLSSFVKATADPPAESIRRLDIETWNHKKTPLEIVRTFFRWLVDVAQVLAASPCDGISVPKSQHRSRVLDRLELVLCRRSASRPLREILLALSETAGRPLEMRAARWDQIRNSGGGDVTEQALRAGACYFSLSNFKARERRSNPHAQRVIPISPRLGRLLVRLRGRLTDRAGEIFRSKMGRAWTLNALRCAMIRLKARLDASQKVKTQGLCPYLLRHSKATELARRGVNARLLADLLGHTSLELLGWYVHPSTSCLCEVMQGKI